MSFRKLQCCMAYMVLAVSLVGGIYIIFRDYLAFVFYGSVLQHCHSDISL